jgi:hypothetical protein
MAPVPASKPAKRAAQRHRRRFLLRQEEPHAQEKRWGPIIIKDNGITLD